MLTCPNDEALAAWADGNRSEPAVGEHLDGCEACRRVVSSIARLTQDEAPRRGAVDVQLTVGERFDRYVVLDELGRGAMGTVFAAWDPRLERRVALKILGAASNEGAMLAEARALARVEHPNVVKVFDVNRSGGLRYLTLELIEGTTLRQWLAIEERSHRERLDAVLAAGRGLEAAHQAGVLHRDFKPDNVLVSATGLVSITDFGLAQRTDRPEQRQGGTRGYLAPELAGGATATPASDQFAFAISALEVLEHGGKKATRRVSQALKRATSEDPSRRFATLGALLRELEPRWFGWAGAGAATAALAIIAAIFWANRPAVCGGAAEALISAWSPELSKQVLERRAAQSFAPDQTRWVLARLDQYAQLWREAHTDACRATRVRGEQTEAMLSARMLCLDERREALAALVKGFLSDDRAVGERAVIAVEQLPQPSACSNISSLMPPPALPADDAAAQLRRRSLDSIRVLATAGRYEKVKPLVEALLTDVKQANDTALLPNVLNLLATATGALGDEDKAEGIWWQAIAASRGPGSDEVAVRSMLALLALANVHSRHREALVINKLVESRLGGVDEATRTPLELSRAARTAWALQGLNRRADARAELRTAMDTIERAGPSAPIGDATSQVADTLAQVLNATGDHANAARLWRLVYRLRSLQYGPMAYRAFPPLYNEALAHASAGRFAEALAVEKQAQAVAEAWGGDRTRMLVGCHTLLTYLPALQSDWPAAQVAVEIALKELNSAAPVTEHLEALSLAAMIAAARHDEGTARELANRALEQGRVAEDLDESDLAVAGILAKPPATWCASLNALAADSRVEQWSGGWRLTLGTLDRALAACPGPRPSPAAAPPDAGLDKEIARLEQAINQYLTAN